MDHKQVENNTVKLIKVLSKSNYNHSILTDHRGDFDIFDSEDLMIIVDKTD